MFVFMKVRLGKGIVFVHMPRRCLGSIQDKEEFIPAVNIDTEHLWRVFRWEPVPQAVVPKRTPERHYLFEMNALSYTDSLVFNVTKQSLVRPRWKLNFRSVMKLKPGNWPNLFQTRLPHSWIFEKENKKWDDWRFLPKWTWQKRQYNNLLK